jgi:hypothetical protein
MRAIARGVSETYPARQRRQASMASPAAIKPARRLLPALPWRVMIHAVALIGAVFWLGLVGLLWYVKPGDLYWLLGSAVLGVVFFAGFFFYLQLTDSRGAAK